ncbi:glycosyltransferase family 2 protein [Patescibacteria group bacterium]|nr:glycosyltransferase family 2 protein [Patescibacteria group bacterium]
MNKIHLSVIIPVYNEEKRLSSTLLNIDKYLSEQEYDYEIIVVNDGSKDNTAKIVKKFSYLIKNLKLIDNRKNHGKGWVVRQAMLESEGKIRLFMDADNATTIEHFEKMIPFFKKGYQVVIGSRDRKDAKGAKQAVPQSFFKRQLGNLGNLLIQIVAVPGIWDTQCGFKAFTRKAAENIFSRAKIDRWGFDIEALFLARKLGLKIGIIPVIWVNAPDSKVNLKGYLNTFKELFVVRLNSIRGKYKL